MDAKILIVDDQEKEMIDMESALHPEGCEVIMADNGKQALEMAEDSVPDLILLDFKMAEREGFKVFDKLQENSKTKNIPVISMVPKSDSDVINKGFEQGVVDYISKPVSKPELLARIRPHLRLRKTEAQLKEANQTKDKFYSIIAHDIRNPFHQLFGFSDLLRTRYDHLNDEKKRKLIDNICKITKNTYGLLDNLLDWSKYQSGQFNKRAAVFNFAKSVIDVVDLLYTEAELKKISLFSTVKKETMVYANQNMITTVLRNLVSNAIKFTPEKGHVQIASLEKDEFLEVTVSDSGVGIDEKYLPKLFEKDAQHSTTGTNSERGSGLGLRLCKEFVELNGGNIWVSSKPNAGSLFSFTIPVAKE